MKRYIKTISEPCRGVFWIIDDKLLAFSFTGESTLGLADSGLTFNHKRLWPEIRPKGCNKSFDYYPRGRVEFDSKGNPIIYMNPNISEDWLPELRKQFGLRSTPRIKYDGSSHYRCHLDDGYTPQK